MPSRPATARPKPGTELELVVDDFAFGGAGVARLDGYVVFVRGAVPGDRVLARVTRSKRDYAEAILADVVEPSPERIAPQAPHPGAPWGVLPYERQLEEKERQVREALERYGGFDTPPVAPIVAAEQTWRYRNKLEYSFGESDEGELLLGFHKPGRWNEIEDVTEDVLASQEIDAVRNAARDWARAEGLSAWDRRSGAGFLRNLVVREGRRSGQVQARIVTSEGDFRAEAFAAALGADSVLWTQTGGVAETTRDGKTVLLQGEEWIEETLCGLRFRISHEAFFQTNTEMAERLYGEAAAAAALSGSERVYDLFCGIGTIGLSLARQARELWGVELIEQAIGDAQRNAALNGIGNAHFLAGDVRTAMRPLVERAGKPDVILVDPPRAGLSQKVVRRILETEPLRIVYVSCNPTTLAPNARQIADAGYELRSVKPVDMFPQTPHIECVALFERST
ncbi:MAG TPA: 23S rRNA (uracil(1939)-C(5))-methyltransferase RlmD [Thermoleophilaceae bacterium]|jgi:23S rRNA (uracil1939-C5)-methyltransferase|nr:23S rRNA (uracil(1939)-C(5))-methyltransferase RlmD [Thermoleophilaceae bacterium]